MFFFAVWAGAQAPPKQQKKKTRPRPNSKKKKKKNAPAPSERVFFLLFGRVGVFIVLLCGRGPCFFLLFGRGACSFFCCLGWGVFFFLLFGRGRVLFLLFGPGACFFFFLLFRRGTGVHSLTRLPGSSLSDPTTKETEQQKKNTGSYLGLLSQRFSASEVRAS